MPLLAAIFCTNTPPELLVLLLVRIFLISLFWMRSCVAPLPIRMPKSLLTLWPSKTKPSNVMYCCVPFAPPNTRPGVRPAGRVIVAVRTPGLVFGGANGTQQYITFDGFVFDGQSVNKDQ